MVSEFTEIILMSLGLVFVGQLIYYFLMDFFYYVIHYKKKIRGVKIVQFSRKSF